jgi:hypothetical protein
VHSRPPCAQAGNHNLCFSASSAGNLSEAWTCSSSAGSLGEAPAEGGSREMARPARPEVATARRRLGAAAATCQKYPGLRYSANDKGPDTTVAAADADACCALCANDMAKCLYWSFTPAAANGTASGTARGTASGTTAQPCGFYAMRMMESMPEIFHATADHFLGTSANGPGPGPLPTPKPQPTPPPTPPPAPVPPTPGPANQQNWVRPASAS